MIDEECINELFLNAKEVEPKQAMWQDFLVDFDYRLKYKLEKANVIIYALSRKAQLELLSMS